ncbi:MAG: hypothetical protein HC903_18890 [Methylacidiphilales bacterium]|nr:hypothetical protein [Candidatus Methylacidiphilales bacterium]NJR18139.1 hypothetical protein [Calothrix sp. CSU_2_0]
MANIKISQLYPAGSELFLDSESFLSELTDAATEVIGGAGLADTLVKDGQVYTYIIETPVVKNTETKLVQTKNSVSVGVGLETYSVITAF